MSSFGFFCHSYVKNEGDLSHWYKNEPPGAALISHSHRNAVLMRMEVTLVIVWCCLHSHNSWFVENESDLSHCLLCCEEYSFGFLVCLFSFLDEVDVLKVMLVNFSTL